MCFFLNPSLQPSAFSLYNKDLDMQLEQQLRNKLKENDILLMTHIVLGYPSLDVNREIIRQMVDNGVDCIEMQIPFLNPWPMDPSF